MATFFFKWQRRNKQRRRNLDLLVKVLHKPIGIFFTRNGKIGRNSGQCIWLHTLSCFLNICVAWKYSFWVYSLTKTFLFVHRPCYIFLISRTAPTWQKTACPHMICNFVLYLYIIMNCTWLSLELLTFLFRPVISHIHSCWSLFPVCI